MSSTVDKRHQIYSFSSHVKTYEIHDVIVPHLGRIPILKGDFHKLSPKVQDFIANVVELCTPRAIYICDGSQEEADEIIHKLVERGTLTPLRKHENVFLCRTDPSDVARVEGKTFISTPSKYTSVPHVADGVKGILGQWMSPEEAEKEMDNRWPKCMTGRTMYVIPFSMGPLGSPLSKIGVQLTDSSYVLLCMRIMARVCPKVWHLLGDLDFVKCLHSVGVPRPVQRKVINNWPCDPIRTMIAHFPEERKVVSFGSGYGGNALLGKKCFALRIATCIARDEGWMAEHMLIMGVTPPDGEEKFIVAAFPSACGKTNMAMMEPSLPGWKVRCVGDDIAWMKFDENGVLRAINPEYGFFGVAPGTNHTTNPNAMVSLNKNSILTNVAETSDGSYFWEGLEDEVACKEAQMTNWLGRKWKIGDEGFAAHPNSRFCSPAGQCPIIHPDWEKPDGVPVEAIIFGGRRPVGVPLVIESFTWQHGVFMGAQLKSETTAAAEFKGKSVMHDPMAMRPFFGYNAGQYFQHWLNFDNGKYKLPKVFHVNWFRKSDKGKFVWPGFGENIRVLDWVLRRCANSTFCVKSPVGLLPKEGDINVTGIKVEWDACFSVPRDYFLEDIEETRKWLTEQVGSDLPQEIINEINAQEERLQKM